jgi:hypothetical protein
MPNEKPGEKSNERSDRNEKNRAIEAALAQIEKNFGKGAYHAAR